MTGLPSLSYDRNYVTTSADSRLFGDRVARPTGCLVHSIDENNYAGWNRRAKSNPAKSPSYSAIIEPTGTQYITADDSTVGNHAGRSTYTGDRVYKDSELDQIFLGIALCYGKRSTPTFEQYDSLADLVIMYAWRWRFTWPYTILGSYAVAEPPGRSAGPYGFDWGKWLGRLYFRSAQMRLPGL